MTVSLMVSPFHTGLVRADRTEIWQWVHEQLVLKFANHSTKGKGIWKTLDCTIPYSYFSIYICIYMIYICIYVFVCVYVCLRVYKRVCGSVWVCVRVYVYR